MPTTIWSTWTSYSSSASTSIPWTYWTTDNATGTTDGTTSAAWPVRALTAQELAAENERVRVDAEQARRRAEEARVARERAEALLREHLSAEQQASLDREQAFLVSVTSGRRYQIRRGHAGNVQELDEHGQALRLFCLHPDDVPDPDAMLAQKLLLETDEAAFRRLANITELRQTA